jgi:hypothetical protein
MCTCVTPNEIFPYLFLCRAMLSPTINFVPTLHCSYQKIRETLEHGWHFKKVEHHTSKIKVYMCARATPKEMFPSLFLCRAMLSPTTNFSLALHCSYQEINETHEHGISKELHYIHLKSKCVCVCVRTHVCSFNQTFPLLMHQHKQ